MENEMRNMGLIAAYKKSVEDFRKLGLGHDKEFNDGIDLTLTTVDESKYDAIDITDVSLDVIADTNRQITGLEALSKKVVLNDFILKLRDSGGTVVRFLIHCYNKKDHLITANNGKRYRRFIDVYQFGLDNDKVVNVSQVVILHNKYPLRYRMRRVALRVGKRLVTRHIGAFERFQSLDNGSPILSGLVALADPEWENRTEYVLYHYHFVLHEMVNRPERFVEAGNGERKVFKGLNEVPKPRPIIKPEHKVVLPPEPEKEPANSSDPDSEEHRTIQCPYWTVSGHNRTLKSGKVIWIEPYAKGKDRNNPDRIQAKTYKIEKE